MSLIQFRGRVDYAAGLSLRRSNSAGLDGGAAVPRDRFGGILRHADAGDIHAAEDELRLGVARLGPGAEVCEGAPHQLPLS